MEAPWVVASFKDYVDVSNAMLKIALLSSTVFGYRCLRDGILKASNVQVVGILTTPRRIKISYATEPVEIASHAKFDESADQIGCEVISMTGNMDSQNYLQYIQKWNPDLLLALGWYYMIPRNVRENVALGCAGIHASLLPLYRGGAPIPWAIINGETETGVTFFYFSDGVDDGDMMRRS